MPTRDLRTQRSGAGIQSAACGALSLGRSSLDVEGVSRFIALFHSKLPTSLGPTRSARTGDVDLLFAMNRPVFAYSGSNPGVAAWLASADTSDLIVDLSAQANGCYLRRDDRPGPHNLGVHPPSVVDSRSPHAVTVGTGDSVVHRDGVAYTANWSRPTALDPYVSTDDATGAEIPVDVGRTFLEIFRTDAPQM